MGKLRVDAFAKLLEIEHPKPSDAYNNFYTNVWNPKKYYENSPDDPVDLDHSHDHKGHGHCPGHGEQPKSKP